MNHQFGRQCRLRIVDRDPTAGLRSRILASSPIHHALRQKSSWAKHHGACLPGTDAIGCHLHRLHALEKWRLLIGPRRGQFLDERGMLRGGTTKVDHAAETRKVAGKECTRIEPEPWKRRGPIDPIPADWLLHKQVLFAAEPEDLVGFHRATMYSRTPAFW